MKRFILAAYFSLCLIALTGEPTGDVSLRLYLSYYIFVLANLIISAILINKNFKSKETFNSKSKVL